MKEFRFEPGEEKLAEIMEMIAGLQRLVVQLGQRSEVDGILMSLLLDELDDPAATLEGWKSKMAQYYPERAVAHLGSAGMDVASEELNRRVSLWTQALEARVQARDSP